MLGSLRKALSQVRTPFVVSGKMIDSSGSNYTLEPVQENMMRLMKFAGEPGSQSLTALEVSCFLYDFANQDSTAIQQKLNSAEQKKKQVEQGNPAMGFVSFFIDSEYRNYTKIVNAVKQREEHIRLCFSNLVKLLKYTPPEEVPVATVSNTLYSAAKLDLDITPHMELILDVLKKKAHYLHAQGIAEALWGISKLGVKDASIEKTLVDQLKSRELDFVQVESWWLNHLEYKYSEEQNELSNLLKELNHPDLKGLSN